jgi:hypothetical protein
MRTNRNGHVTPAVEMHKAIKQGCPLAPLLFVIVMDELHCALREHHEGYSIGKSKNFSKRVASRGYCDDTCIFSQSMKELNDMNRTVHSFFEKHGLIISETKTKITGRHANGSPLTESVVWPGSNKPFEVVPPGKPIKHLGCLITVDLDWTAQVNKMNSSIMSTLDHLKSGRLTTLQAAILTKYVTGPKMEIGMRHANISLDRLSYWDKLLSSALAKRAGLGTASLHRSGTATTCRLTPLVDQYDLTKLAYALELLTSPSELQSHYRLLLKPIINDIDALASDAATADLSKFSALTSPMPSMAMALKRLARRSPDGTCTGLRIRANNDSRAHLKACKNYWPVKTARHGAKRCDPDTDCKTCEADARRDTPDPPRHNDNNTEIDIGDDNSVANDDDVPLAGEAGRCRPLKVTSNGVEIPAWCTHDLWGSKFDKSEALAHDCG